jgi:hypothetical protein
MGRVCTICTHSAQAAIGAALETTRSLRDIAAEFNVSKTALHRHWQTHISGQPAPNSVNLMTVPGNRPGEIAPATHRPPILRWVAIGGIGVVVVWRALVALRG